MQRPVFGFFWRRRSARTAQPRRGGFTLVELLVAVTLTLVMMAAVVQIFALVGRSVSNSRSTLEMSDRLRAAANRLRLDLEGATADMTPPGRPENGKGYFEYVEGPIGPVPGSSPGFNTDEGGILDSTVGDRDDILQFTTRSRNEPFVGRGLQISDATNVPRRIAIKSQVAEVAWFLRGTTLYRRVLLVSPSFDADLTTPNEYDADIPWDKKKDVSDYFQQKDGKQIGFYNNFDLSGHWDVNGTGGINGGIVCNTLADLTRRECRYAHPPFTLDGTANGFPHSLHLSTANYGDWYFLGLPTLQECSHSAWPFPINGLMPIRTMAGVEPAVTLTQKSAPYHQFDAWANPYPFNELDPDTGTVHVNLNPTDLPSRPTGWQSSKPAYVPPYYLGPRVGEDVILTNVLSFDVKAWDPRAPVLLINDNASTPTYNQSLLPGDASYIAALTADGTYPFPASSPPQLASRGAYVDLGYGYDYVVGAPIPAAASDFSGIPNPNSRLTPLLIYDTWSIHYEHDGVDQDGGTIDEGTDGFDNNGDGVIDDPGEWEAPPPYIAPLRGIQVKIRVFEPDSRQIREVTIRHDFLNN